MTSHSLRKSDCRLLLTAALLATSAAVGCGILGDGPSPQGTFTDPIWIAQEENAEPSKFVVYQHEFVYNQPRLNWAGEDHVKQIAARLHAGQNFPVLIERSITSKRDDTEYKYPVHPKPELDMHRRAVVVQALTAMGIPDAEQRVIVSPALTRGLEDGEAERAYMRSFFMGGGYGGFGGGFGGFGGGIGGGGGFGT
jgi:hypothetical protein